MRKRVLGPISDKTTCARRMRSNWGRVVDHGSRVVDRDSRVVDHGSRVVDRGSRVVNRGSRVVDSLRNFTCSATWLSY